MSCFLNQRLLGGINREMAQPVEAPEPEADGPSFIPRPHIAGENQLPRAALDFYTYAMALRHPYSHMHQ